MKKYMINYMFLHISKRNHNWLLITKPILMTHIKQKWDTQSAIIKEAIFQTHKSKSQQGLMTDFMDQRC